MHLWKLTTSQKRKQSLQSQQSHFYHQKTNLWLWIRMLLTLPQKHLLNQVTWHSWRVQEIQLLVLRHIPLLLSKLRFMIRSHGPILHLDSKTKVKNKTKNDHVLTKDFKMLTTFKLNSTNYQSTNKTRVCHHLKI